MNRREFFQRSTIVGAGIATGLARSHATDSANSKVTVAIVGASRNPTGGDGRGSELAVGFASLPDAEVAYICDVDEHHVAAAIESVTKKGKQSRAPKGEKDFRRILDDKSVDAVVIATPDHWHTPAALLALSAGKNVYVEKPCCHNPHEGELLVASARKHAKVVQHGTQRRSWPAIVEGIERIKAGEIGRVLLARGWYFNNRPTIGHGKPAPIPLGLDYDLWQGPAPAREFHDNYLHYNWHWFWHWGTGELGNNGVHMIDVCRWGLGVDYPTRVTSSGGKYRFDDDQETPDTNIATFDFGEKSIVFESRSWATRTPQDPPDDIEFFGENGSLRIKGSGYTLLDPAGKEIAKNPGTGGNAVHLQNFVDAILDGKKLNAEIEEGYKSALLCHLGNIAWRKGRAVHFDPATKKITDDKESATLWHREYRKGWEPKV